MEIETSIKQFSVNRRIQDVPDMPIRINLDASYDHLGQQSVYMSIDFPINEIKMKAGIFLNKKQAQDMVDTLKKLIKDIF